MSRIHSFCSLLALAATLFLLSEPLLADKPDKKGASAKQKNESVSGTVSGELSYSGDSSFSVTVTAGISFGEARRLAVDSGLTGYKPLPPGIRKNMARGKPMPPGIAKTRMPGSFVGQLPHHDGYEWRQAGTDLVLIAIGTLIIADVLERVFD
jgi:hypothetical protein